MSTPIIPNRKKMREEENEQAQLYLRQFEPRNYSTYYRRIFDPYAYFEQIGIDKVCELIEHGNGLLNVAKLLDVSGSTLRRWINKNETYRNQILLAHKYAGNAYAYKAEEALLAARFGTKEQIALAGKLAEHYRWMATKLDRELFGEAKNVDANAGKPPIILNLNMGGVVDEEKVVNPKALPLISDILKLQPIDHEPE